MKTAPLQTRHHFAVVFQTRITAVVAATLRHLLLIALARWFTAYL